MKIDPQKDKKQIILVNVLGCAAAVLLIVLGNRIVPLSSLFDRDNAAFCAVRLLTAAAGAVLYLLLHEPFHGFFMKRLSGAGVKYGFTGLFAYVGSEAFFNKKSYMMISLMPAAVWTMALAVLCFTSPASVFWIFYFMQTVNLSAAVGDLYVSCIVAGLPADILIRDSGVSLTVYAK